VEKHIVKWSYRLGMVSAVIALVLRAFNAFGVGLPTAIAQGRTLWYMSFYKGALLFFLMAIATANRIWSRNQQ
jgi:hypothetical protein